MKTRIPKNPPPAKKPDPQERIIPPTPPIAGPSKPLLEATLSTDDGEIALRISKTQGDDHLSKKELARASHFISEMLAERAEKLRAERQAEADLYLEVAFGYKIRETELEGEIARFLEGDAERLEECRGALRGMDIILDELRRKIAQINREIDVLEKKRNEIDDRIGRKGEKLSRFQFSLPKLIRDAEDLRDRMPVLSKSERRLSAKRLDEVEAKIAEAKAGIKETESYLTKQEALKARIDETKERFLSEKRKLEDEIESTKRTICEIQMESAMLERQYIVVKFYGDDVVVAASSFELEDESRHRKKWEVHVTNYLEKHRLNLSLYEFFSAVKILTYLSKASGEIQVVYGDGTERVKALVEDIRG